MRKMMIVLAMALLNFSGLPRAFGEDPVGSVPKEAAGFVGTLTGQVAKVGSDHGWASIKVAQVLGFVAGNKNKLKVDDLNAIWKDRYSTIIAAQNAPPLPMLKVGDTVLVTAFQFEAHLRCTRVAICKAGEEEPDAYLFVKKIENDGKVSVVLRKMFDEKTVTLPVERGADGKLAPKADLLNTVNALAENTVIVVQFDNGLVKSIKAYEPPRRVEFVRKVTQKVAADSTTKPVVPERTLVGMEVQDNGASATLLIDPADKSAAAMAAKIGSFKAGQFLLIHSTTDGKGAWLSDVKIDPDQARPKDAAAKP